MQPLVSIVTPMFNAEAYVSQTIESVLSQTYSNWEMIIVDNYSTDKSKEIVHEYCKKDNRIKLVKLDYNSGGPARPRNVGIKNSKGDFIAYLDADDLWQKDKLEKQLNFFQNNPDVYLCYSTYQLINENSTKLDVMLEKRKKSNGCTFESLFLSFNFIPSASVMIKIYDKEVIFFDENPKLVAAEDFDLWLRIAKSKKIGFIDEPLLLYRIHENNTSGNVSYRISRNWNLIQKWKIEVNNILLVKKYFLFFIYVIFSFYRAAIREFNK